MTMDRRDFIKGLVAVVPIAGMASSIAFAAPSGEMYVAEGTCTLWWVDPETLEMVKVIEMPCSEADFYGNLRIYQQ